MTRRQLYQWMTVVVLFFLLIGIAHISETLTNLHWQSLVNYETPYINDLDPVAPSEGTTDRMVLVIIDSLRENAIEHMPHVSTLQQEGSYWTLEGIPPTQTLPTWATIISGTDPDIHGVATGFHSAPLQADHIISSAKRNDIFTFFAGNRSWDGLLGDSEFDQAHYEFYSPTVDPGPEPDERSAEELISVLNSVDEGLFILNLNSLKNVTLTSGAQTETTRPSPYEIRLGIYDEIIEDITRQLDWENDTLLMTASHGTIDQGGHGGHEPQVANVPLIMLGRGIDTASGGQRYVRDLAPTISTILGMHVPSHSTGTPLLDGLALEDNEKLEIGNSILTQNNAMYNQISEVLQGQESFEIDEISHPNEITEVNSEWASAIIKMQAENVSDERGNRWSLLALTVLIAIIWGIILYRMKNHTAPLYGLLLTAVIGFGLIFLLGGRFSMTDIKSAEHFAIWFRAMRGQGIIVAATLGMMAGLIVGREGSYTYPELFQTALNTIATGMVALMLFVGIYTYLYGYTAAWTIPPLRGWILTVSSTIFVTAMGQLSILGMALSWLGAVMTVNWWLD